MFYSLVQGHADMRGRYAHLGGIRIRVRIELVIARRRSKEHGHRRRFSVRRPFHFELFHQRDDLCIGLDKPLTGPSVDRRQAYCAIRKQIITFISMCTYPIQGHSVLPKSVNVQCYRGCRAYQIVFKIKSFLRFCSFIKTKKILK